MIVAAATYVYFSAQSIYASSLLRSVAIMRTRTGHSGPADTDLAPCHRTVDAILSRHGTFQTPLLVGRGSLGDKVPTLGIQRAWKLPVAEERTDAPHQPFVAACMPFLLVQGNLPYGAGSVSGIRAVRNLQIGVYEDFAARLQLLYLSRSKE